MEKKVLARNKKANHDYFIEKTFEAGIALKGTEVKSIRQGKANLKESYCMVRKGEIYIVGMHVSPYKEGNIFNEDPIRDRKLLLTKREILRISQDIKLKQMALIPLALYTSGRLIKLEVALARGKKQYDKRESIKEKDIKRDLMRKKF